MFKNNFLPVGYPAGYQRPWNKNLTSKLVGTVFFESLQSFAHRCELLVAEPEGLHVGEAPPGLTGLRVGLNADLALARLAPQPVVCHHRALLGEALDVLGLLREEGHRDEEREVCLLYTSPSPRD